MVPWLSTVGEPVEPELIGAVQLTAPVARLKAHSVSELSGTTTLPPSSAGLPRKAPVVLCSTP
jgi:hypothetical protein